SFADVSPIPEPVLRLSYEATLFARLDFTSTQTTLGEIMDIAKLEMRLADLKATALADVRRAASDDDTAATIHAGDRLKGVNSLEEKLGAAKGIVLSVEGALERYARLNANGG